MTSHTETPPPVLVRARGAAQLLSLVPHLAGFTPHDSLVLVPFADSRALGAVRIDLPGEDADAAEIAAGVVGQLLRVHHVTGAAVVVYTDDVLRPGAGRVARADLADALRQRLDDCRVDTVDALCVAADGWVSYLEPDAPYAGHPLEEIDPDTADVPPQLRERLQSHQADGVELPPSDLAERERVARALRGRSIDLASPVLREVIEDLLADDDAELTVAELATLVLILDRPATRDVALEQWSGGAEHGRAVQAFQVAWSRGDRGMPEGPLRLMGEGPLPEHARLVRALDLARKAAAVAPRERRAGPLAAAAWLSWALGRSTHAAHYVGLAREIDPQHGLSEIMATMIAAGHLPGWLYDRPIPGPVPRNRAERRRWARSRRR